MLPANSEYNDISFKPFIIHQTKIEMGETAKAEIKALVGNAATNWKILIYIGYPAGGVLIAIGLFFLLKSFGCLGKKEERERYNSTSDPSYLKAINDDDDNESNYKRSDD